MGKRFRRKNALKSISQTKPIHGHNFHALLMTKEQCALEPCSEPIRLMRQVKECISEIYAEHKNDLEQRRIKRLESKNPTDFFIPYNLIVNSAFQQRIRLQIQALIKFQLGEALKEGVIACMNDFINSLYEFVKNFEGKKSLLQIIILYEAFHTLQNSISQIGNIVSDLISKYAFEIINKKNFAEKIAASYFDMIEDVKKKESSQYLGDVIKMKNELENIQPIIDEERCVKFEYESTIYSDSCSEIESTGEALHNLPIDELVEIISKCGSSCKKVKTNKRKNRGKKNSKIKENPEAKINEEDREILRFSLTLDFTQNSECKQKPAVSEIFLESLREKIKNLQINP